MCFFTSPTQLEPADFNKISASLKEYEEQQCLKNPELHLPTQRHWD